MRMVPLALAFVYLAVSAKACFNNYNYKYFNEWEENGNWKTNSEISPNFDYKLTNWELRLEFNEPLVQDMKSWAATGYGQSQGKTIVVLKAKAWNKVMDPQSFKMSYVVSFKRRQGTKHLKCVEFCGNKEGSDQNICTSWPQTTPKILPATTAPVIVTSTKTTSSKATTKNSLTTTTSASTKNPSSCSPKYDYKEVLEKSLLFYEAQRSGKLPVDQRVKWRKDSTTNDGAPVSLDLTGGYFDAGDYVKFGFPMAATITNLAWGMIEFKKAYKSVNQWDYGLEAIKWGTDYFLKCHPSPTRFIGQVGNGKSDHGFWRRPQDITSTRSVYDIDQNRPGSELAGETASALAASYLVFKESGKLSYASRLLKHAKQLYSFAMKYRGQYHVAIPEAADFYRSWSGYKDELAWASLWLYRATGQDFYKTNFLKEFNRESLSQDPGEFSWDNKWYGVKVLAQQLKISNNDYLVKFKSYLQQPKKTPKGLFYVQMWGPNRHAANLAFLATVASTLSDKNFYLDFARSQIHYMLGDSGRSYVIGFGNNPPQRPHHRSSSCLLTGACGWNNFNSPNPNPYVLHGALVGGPDKNDNYVDNRSDYIKNEVACDYNAGFQSAVAGLIYSSLQGIC